MARKVKKSVKFVGAVLLALAIVLLFSGCGTDNMSHPMIVHQIYGSENNVWYEVKSFSRSTGPIHYFSYTGPDRRDLGFQVGDTLYLTTEPPKVVN